MSSAIPDDPATLATEPEQGARSARGARARSLTRRVTMRSVRAHNSSATAGAGSGFSAVAGADPRHPSDGEGGGQKSAARRDRLADRLAQFARQRRQDEEAAARIAAEARDAAAKSPTDAAHYTVSDALPLELLGYMTLMLRNERTARDTPQQPPASPPPAAPDAVASSPATPGIAALMARYGSTAPEPAPDVPAATALALPSAAAAPPAAPQPSPETQRVLTEALSALDPVRRLATALRASAPGETAIVPAGAPPPAIMAAPSEPPQAPAPAHVQLQAEPEPAWPKPPQPQRAAAPFPIITAPTARPSGWPSFATGFAIALAFGAGLYVYLTSA